MVDSLGILHGAWRCNQHQTTSAGNLRTGAPPRTVARLTGRGGCPTLLSDRAQRRGTVMEVVVLPPLVALIAGILILIVPRLLNYIVAIYLILIGLLGLLGHYSG
jgi:Protein of unknown function (DUF3096)